MGEVKLFKTELSKLFKRVLKQETETGLVSAILITQSNEGFWEIDLVGIEPFLARALLEDASKYLFLQENFDDSDN